MAKLAVLVVHGMGDQESDFADGMIADVEKWLKRARLDPDDIEWEPAWWAPVLEKAQSDLWRRSSRNNDLDYQRLRKFVVHALGDAVAYRKVDPNKRLPAGVINTYEEIHRSVSQSVADLRRRSRADKPDGARDVPLVVVAHSLGAHIMSNYIWDRQKRDAVSLGNDFEDMKTLSGLSTFGCNIPLFTLAYSKVQPIRFPLPVTKYFPRGTGADRIRAATRWWNYYDPDDVLGWPLKPLSTAYGRTVHRDVAIEAGGLFTAWNPMSHSAYWTDRSYTKPLAAAIGKLLKLL